MSSAFGVAKISKTKMMAITKGVFVLMFTLNITDCDLYILKCSSFAAVTLDGHTTSLTELWSSRRGVV